MELIEEKQKVIVKYLREKPQYEAKIKYVNNKPEAYIHTIPGKIIGCLVAVNKNIVGWSLVNKLDRPWVDEWNKPDFYSYPMKEQQDILKKIKNLAYQIAYNRAMIADGMDGDALFNYYLKAPLTLQEEILKLQERSEKYFK